MGAYEDMMSGTEEISSAPDKGLLGNAWSDVTSTLSNYGTGAVQGFKEVVRSGNQLAESNPLALTGTPMKEGLTNAPAPPQTEQQQQDLTQYGKATGTFAEETIKPVLGAAALVNPIAAAAYTPLLVNDIQKSYQEGGVGQAARDLTYGPVVDFASQPDLYQQFKNRPVSTTASGAMSVLPLALMGRGLHESLTKIPKVTEKGTLLREPNPAIAEDFSNFKPTEEVIKETAETIHPTETTIREPKQLPVESAVEDYAGVENTTKVAANLFGEELSNEFGVDAIITSGKRSPENNALSNGSPTSWHLQGKAIDMYLGDISAEKQAMIKQKALDAGWGEVLYHDAGSGAHLHLADFKGDISQLTKNTQENIKISSQVRNEKSSAEATRQIAEDQASADVVSKDLSDIVNKSEETWKMSKEKYDKMMEEEPMITTAEKASFPHEKIIEQAIKEEKPVPMEVLKDYPELVTKYPAEIDRIESKLNQGEQASLGGYSTIPAETTYSKPVTRSEIIKDVNELIPARAGRIGSFEGLYKGDPGVIRSKNYGDVETLSHEIGHFVDSKLNIVGHDAELINAADTQWTGNKSYDKYTPEQRRAEGIAEFGRQYMINKAEALKNFPTYGKDFVAKLATDKKLANQVENISNKMRAWHAQPAEARGRGGLSFGYENEKSFKQRAEYLGVRAYELMVDDKIGLTRFVSDFEKATGTVLETKNNPEKLARLANNSAMAKSDIMVSELNAVEAIKTLNVHYDGALVHDVTFNSIIGRISKELTDKEYPEYLSKGNFRNWNEAFDTYLVAKRQLEIQSSKENYTGSMSKADAQKIIKDAPKQFEDIAQDFYNYNDNIMRLRVAEGITSATEYAEMKVNNQNYAHMARDFEDTSSKVGGKGVGKGFGNIADKLKSLTEEGSARSVVSPLESAISDTYSTLNMIERNRVAQAFVRLSDVNGAGRFVEKVTGNADAKNSIFTIMTDGKKQAYQTEPEYYRAIMSVNESTANPIVQLLSYPAKWLRAGAVLSPEFFIKNPLKDTLEAFIYSKNGFIPVIDTIKGVFAMFKNEDMYNEYKSSGAIMSSFLNSDRTTLNTKISDAMKGKSFENPAESVRTLIKTTMTEPKKLPVESFRALTGSLQWLTDISETGTRLGDYMKARKLGKPIIESALGAGEVTLNYSRSGSLGKTINQMIPFFNAAIQGSDKMAREFYKDPKGVSGKIATAITIPTIVVALLGINDQEIQELPNYEKDTFWIIRTGDKLLRIPKPLGLNAFANVTEEAIRHMYQQNPRSIEKFITNTAGGFVPNLIPTAALTLTEWATNYSFFREKQIVPQALQNTTPSKQYNAYTSETAKALGNITNQSPMKIDNAINNLGGGLAGFFVLGADKLINTISGTKNELPAKNITEQPIIKALFSKNAGKLSQSTEQFYDKMKELEQDHAENGKKGIIKNELQKYRHANTDLQDIYKKTKAVLGDNNIGADTKRIKIDELQEKHNKIILKALGK